MTVDTDFNDPPARRPGWRKLAVQAGLGGLVGAGGMAVFIAIAEPGMADRIAPPRLLLGGVGVVYLLMGLFTLTGVVSPPAGARMLNVADVDDLRQQRTVLGWSAMSTIAVGLVLALLAVSRGADGDGLVDAAPAMVAVMLLMIGSAIVTVALWSRYDELMRQLSLESSTVALSILLPVLTLWAAADHLGYPVTLDPLSVIAAVYGVVLLGTMVAAWRRGMLTQPA